MIQGQLDFEATLPPPTPKAKVLEIGSDVSRLRAVAPTPTFDLVVREGERGVDLRELHQELDSRQDFTTWARFRLSDFVEGVDFEEVSLEAVEDSEGVYHKTMENSEGRPRKDWSVSIDCAKHSAMMERTERGQRPSCPGVQDISCTNLLLALAPNDNRDESNQQIGAEAADKTARNLSAISLQIGNDLR